ncbi:MAG: hypothetical protein H6567_02300 [Lewinellaceae bacterium]|nr:hypothetical protein [Lewinellaceae bacterium]
MNKIGIKNIVVTALYGILLGIVLQLPIAFSDRINVDVLFPSFSLGVSAFTCGYLLSKYLSFKGIYKKIFAIIAVFAGLMLMLLNFVFISYLLIGLGLGTLHFTFLIWRKKMQKYLNSVFIFSISIIFSVLLPTILFVPLFYIITIALLFLIIILWIPKEVTPSKISLVEWYNEVLTNIPRSVPTFIFISFIIWSIACLGNETYDFTRFEIPLLLVLSMCISLFVKDNIRRSGPFLFWLSIVFTFTMGLLYFINIWLCIVTVSVVVVLFGVYDNQENNHFGDDATYLMLGLFHVIVTIKTIDLISVLRFIEMPEVLIPISILQSVVKDLAICASFIIIYEGYNYIKHYIRFNKE